MAKYNRDVLVATLDAKIADEAASFQRAQAKFEADFAAWKANTVTEVAAKIEAYTPDDEERRGYGFWSFAPPTAPSNHHCSRSEEMRARLMVMGVDKNGNVTLGQRDPILGVAIRCR